MTARVSRALRLYRRLWGQAINPLLLSDRDIERRAVRHSLLIAQLEAMTAEETDEYYAEIRRAPLQQMPTEELNTYCAEIQKTTGTTGDLDL